MSTQTVSGSFTGVGQSAAFSPTPGSPFGFTRGSGYFNLTLYGTFTATISLQRSFDAGVTWHTVSQDATGADATYTTPMSLVALEPEHGVIYRLNCSAYSSGTASYRLSR